MAQSDDRPRSLSEDFENYLDRLEEAGSYFDSKGNLRPELVVSDARIAAKRLTDAGVTSGQLRKFFSRVRDIERRWLDTSKEKRDFDSIRSEIARLRPLADLIINRSQKADQLAPLRDFIIVNAEIASEAADEREFLKGFLVHFECVICYFPPKASR
jgi:CRISPR/Cas system CSM-associated protein Csm2 small subunit